MPNQIDQKIKQSLSQLKKSHQDLITATQKNQKNIEQLLHQVFERMTN